VYEKYLRDHFHFDDPKTCLSILRDFGYGNSAQVFFLALENRAPSNWMIAFFNALLVLSWSMKNIVGITFIFHKE
jgi:hypothetical protein